MSQPEFTVEVATLDQHGDPGFVWYRGAFYTPRSAGRFALTQAAALSDTREVDRVSVVIDSVTDEATRRDVEFIGSPGELAAELTNLEGYKNGVLSTVIPAPREVTAAVAAVLDASPPLPDSAPGVIDVDVIDVEVYSTRPRPIPNSRTEVGAYTSEDAHRIAESLARDLGGTIEPMRSDTVLRVTHAAELSDTDQIAAERFTRVNNLRANISVLNPVADAEHIAALAADLDDLRARSAPAEHTTGAVTAPVSAATAATVPDLDRASTRPRGLVSAPPARTSAAVMSAPTAPHTAPAPTHTMATSRSTDHGLG